MPSLRNMPEQFAKGLTLDATRIERNLEAEEALRDVPPHLMERRFLSNWLVWGYSPDHMASPTTLPWLRERNSIDISPTYLPAPIIRNDFRHKGVATPGIQPQNIENLYTWEVSFQTKVPTQLTRLVAMLVTDSQYTNNFLYGAPTPPTKTLGASVNDCELQIFVDDALDPEVRTRTSVEAGSFQAVVNQSPISVGAVLPGWDTMQPPHPGGPAQGVCLEVHCQASLPAGRIRIAMTIPRYDIANFTTGWGDAPWQNEVWSIAARLSEACCG